MIVLAVDTSLAACQAALLQDGDRLALRSEPMSRGHQERIGPMAAELFEEAGSPPSRVDRVAVTKGPGSFTGLRVGLAFAKGLALGLDRPLIGIGTLEALMAGERRGGRGLAVIQAPHEHVYLQRFADGVAESEPMLVGLQAAEAHAAQVDFVVTAGPVPALRSASCRIEASPWPSILALARLAARREPGAGPLAPLYLRAPDAKTIAERAAARAAAAV